MWITLESEPEIGELLERFDGFHDSCLREVSVSTETFIDEQGAMECPGHLDTSALLFFQSQNKELRAIELRCTGITSFRLRPSADNCDSIISSGTISKSDGQFRLAISFVGGPLTGPPNSGMWLPTRPPEDPDLEIVAQSMVWRPLSDAMGDRFRYRSVAVKD